MLASDSDSDFEFTSGARGGPGGNNGEELSDEGGSSEEDGPLLGKQALGLDPQDTQAYDGRSTPRNGSQYLMKVMAEKRVVPKVVSVDVSLLMGKKKKGEGAEGTPHYLDTFLQVCDGGDGETREGSGLCFLPSAKWKEETVSCFSLVRTRVEQWQYKLEAKEIWISDRVEFPTSNDNTQWIKFCFGNGFAKLIVGAKAKTKEQKLSDFFLDLYDPEVNAMALQRTPPTAKLSESVNVEGVTEDETDDTNGNDSISSEPNETLDELKLEHDQKITPQLGHRPLMSLILQLSHHQLEKLVKWNLLWVQNFGFLNECQGQWLYAILACLTKPVDPSVMSDLRSIVRVLIKIRNKFSNEWGSHFEEGENCVCDERVFDYINTLNLFIYLIALYFQQGDLVMKV